jgi:hypothetical protein
MVGNINIAESNFFESGKKLNIMAYSYDLETLQEHVGMPLLRIRIRIVFGLEPLQARCT